MEGEQTAPNKEEADLATDEDEEEDEEEFFTKDTASSNSTNQDQTVLYETPVLSQIPQPIKQSDGSQVYHLQLLDEDVSHEVSHDVSPNVSQASEPNSFKSRYHHVAKMLIKFM